MPAERLVVEVHVQPRATRPGIVGRRGDAVALRVNAPPTDGRANAEAGALLAAALGVPVRDVTLVHGARSRHKRFAVLGDREVLATRWAAVLATGADRGPERA